MATQPTDFLSGLGGLGNLPHPYDVQQQVAQDRQRQQLGAQAIQQNQNTLNQQAEAQQRQQQFQTDLSTLGSNPSPDGIAGMIRKYPEFSKQLKDSHDIQDEAARDSQFRLQSQIYAAAQGGRYDLASQLLKAHRDASVKAGEAPDPTDDAIITALDSGDPKEQKNALSMIWLSVASINPDKFNETYKTLNGGEGGGSTVINAGGALVDKATGKVLYQSDPANKYITVKNADGSESIVQVGGETGGGGPASSGGAPSGGGGAPTTLPDIVNRIVTIEGTRQNPRSSAVGVGQFTAPTWLSVYKTQNPNSGLSDQDILAKRSDPTVAKQMLTALVQQNSAALQNSGIQPTADNLYLAQFLGANGAVRALKASPSTPISQVASTKQIAANPETLGSFSTVGDLRQWAAGKMAAGAPNSGASAATSQTATAGPKVLYTSKGTTPGDIMSPDELNFYAEKVAGGADLPPLGMGKDAALLRRQILAKAADIALNSGITGGQSNLLHSQLRANTNSLTALGKLQTFVNSAEDTASANADQVLQLAPKGVAGGIPLFNSWVQAGRKATGNPDISKFNLALDTLANEYAKVMTTNTGSGGVTSDAAFQRAHSLLNNAQTIDQLKGTIQQMRIDMGNRKTALARQNDILSGNISNAAGNVHAPASAPAAAPTVAAPAQTGPVQVKTRAEAMALPPGTPFIDPQGVHRVRP